MAEDAMVETQVDVEQPKFGFRRLIGRFRQQSPAVSGVEQGVREPGHDLLSQFQKRVENDPYLKGKDQEKEAELKRLDGMEEVRRALMDYSEQDLQSLETTFKVYFGDLITNLAFLKGGVDVGKFVKARKPEFNMPPQAIDITDNSQIKDYINDRPLTPPITGEREVIEALARKLGLDTRQLIDLRGALSVIPIYINSLMVIDPPRHIINPNEWESESLAGAKASGIRPPQERKQEIANRLTEIQITDSLVALERKAAHVDVKIPLPADKRDAAHYVLNASVARAMEYTTGILAVIPHSGFK